MAIGIAALAVAAVIGAVAAKLWSRRRALSRPAVGRVVMGTNLRASRGAKARTKLA